MPLKMRAHPRSRGENFKCVDGWEDYDGSSPLTRGKRGDAPACAALLGLIPAHAGKTGDGEVGGEHGRAHPRSRGENAYQSRARDIFKGSSPLTRGKLGSHDDALRDRGLIPAHAGKTVRREGP